MTSNTFVKNVEHESAIKHVTGRAIYTDDISEPRNLLHAAIGFSPVSKGIIERIDFSESCLKLSAIARPRMPFFSRWRDLITLLP